MTEIDHKMGESGGPYGPKPESRDSRESLFLSPLSHCMMVTDESAHCSGMTEIVIEHNKMNESGGPYSPEPESRESRAISGVTEI
eukprot:39831-Eustigmatos_ZCMA.PRE.1